MNPSADPSRSVHAHDIFVVVLTGGIASGKTMVSDIFARYGVPIIDTDIIAHQIVQAGKPALKRISLEFGADYLDADGCLDRRKMRNAIFSDTQLKQRLENILHPAIAQEALRKIRQLKGPWCILVIPLLAQSDRYQWVDRVLVVDVNESTQIERVMARDKINLKQARSILQAQSSRKQRLALADDIIDNSGSLTQLEARVAQLHKKYGLLAKRGLTLRKDS